MNRILGALTGLIIIFNILGSANAQVTSSYDTSVVPPTPTTTPTSGYDGGFFVQSPDGDWQMKFGARVDTMFAWESENIFDDPTTLPNEGKDKLSFRLRRAQLYFIPRWKNLKGFILVGWGTGGSTYWVASGTYEINQYLAVQWGVEDPAYDLMSQTSSKRLTMVDNPITVTQYDGEQTVWTDFEGGGSTIARPSFGLPTQIGIFLWGNYFNNRLNWSVAVGNGTEGPNSLNINKRFHYSARVSYVILGESPYGDLTDLSYTETPSFAIGLGGAFEHDPKKNSTQGSPLFGTNEYNWSLDGTADLVFKYRGFAANLMGYYRQLKVGPAAIVERGEKYLTDIGYLATLSMFAIPKKLEFHGWGAQIIREGPDNNAYEYGGGVNYYIKGHQAKFMVDYSRVVDFDDLEGTNNRKHNRVRAKMQIYF